MFKKVTCFIPMLIMLLNLAACVTLGDTFHRVDKKVNGFTKHFEESQFAITERGSYDVELLLLDNGLRVGQNEFEFIVHDSRDADVEGAKITMALKSSGRDFVDLGVKVSDKGNGLYSVKDLTVDSPDPARLKVTVSFKGIEDNAIFSFPDVIAAKTKS